MISLLFYNLGIRFYYVGIVLASFFSKKASRWLSGRAKLQKRLSNYVTSAHGKKIWVHCASLGEFEQARPLIEKIRQQHPEHKLVLTFFSPSGFDVRRYYEGVDYVSYLPLDTGQNARKFIRKLRPSLVIWVKYDFWYNFLYELYYRKIPIVLISSTFRPDQVFFRKYGGLHRKMLGFFKHIFVQNKESQELLSSIDIAAEVCPDTRFDSVSHVLDRHRQMDNVALFKGTRRIIIAGSTWTRDAEMLCQLINNDPFEGEFRYIIAPHEVSKKNIEYLTENIRKRKVLNSRLRPENAVKVEVLIVDTIGLLSNLYYYGDIAYIGGGFNASVHNILEPAVYGMPVIFGPNYHRSEEAKVMLSHPDWHAAHSVRSYEELVATIGSLIDNDSRNLHTGGERSKEFVMSNRGGTDQIYAYLRDNKLI